MEQLVASVLEKSLVGGAFIMMLYFFLTKYSTALDAVGKTLDSVASTMERLDHRMESMEQRIQRLEEKE